ncbi:MAG: polysaccharide deacetylase family protein [Coriobacteriia bacterium]|nr:polysaccharide deacetylase family protein [Coriobacteriia bacterium]
MRYRYLSFLLAAALACVLILSGSDPSAKAISADDARNLAIVNSPVNTFNLEQTRSTAHVNTRIDFMALLPSDFVCDASTVIAELSVAKFFPQSQMWSSDERIDVEVLNFSNEVGLHGSYAFSDRGIYRIQMHASAFTDITKSIVLKDLQSSECTVQIVGNKPIAFTFDDGPHEYCTSQVLDSFDQVGGRATFFITGYRLERAEGAALLRRMTESDHQIGNHRYTHKVHSPQMSDEEFRAEIIKTNEAIAAITGTAPVDFRFPWGDADSAKRKIVSDLDMRMWGWDSNIADGGDYSPLSEDGINLYLDRIMKQVRPYSVMLFHDAENTHNSAAAIGIALEDLTAQGYDFVTLDGLEELKW